jgi:glycine betaine/proline transport system ATP-binding protein
MDEGCNSTFIWNREGVGHMTKIAIKNVYKIFGPKPEEVLARAQAGAGKEELLGQTGHVIGIRNVSLNIEAGETFVVMGLSGSGKSTLIRHINRLIEPTAGQILVDGEDVLKLDEEQLRDLRRHKISMVFQRFGLLPHKTVLENVASGLIIGGTPKDKAEQHAEEQIELVGLAGFENHYPRQLSGGMQQRVGLARALATDAEILLMDEAFSALDPLIRNDMQQQLVELQKRLHKTIVFITHDLDEALRLGNHIAILKDGELRQVGTPEEILTNPVDDYVRRFVLDVNRARVVSAKSVAEEIPTLAASDLNPETAAAAVSRSSFGAAFVLAADGSLVGGMNQRLIDSCNGSLSVDKLLPVAHFVNGAVIDDVLHASATNELPLAVTEESGALFGAVSRRGLMAAISRKPGTA